MAILRSDTIFRDVNNNTFKMIIVISIINLLNNNFFISFLF